MTYKPVLCLDFDGVLHSYTSKWTGADVVADPPVPGAREFLLAVVQTFEVCILSSRSHEAGGRRAMALWMSHYFGAYYVRTGMNVDDVQVDFHVGEDIFPVKFLLHKPPAFLTIDDRALTFRGVWPGVDDLLAFKPWNKGPPTDLDAKVMALENVVRRFARHYELNDCHEKDHDDALEIPVSDLAAAVLALSQYGSKL